MNKRRPKRLRIVITAGPTREHFDPVRFLSNGSSGKMGYAIATAARAAGHHVVLVSGPVSLESPQGVRTVHVTSADQMLRVTRREFQRADAGIFAAAVCDHRPAVRRRHKGRKNTTSHEVTLVPTVDIAAAMGRVKGPRVTVGFALEDHNGRASAARKLAAKQFDAIVLNSPENLGSDRASAQVLDCRGKWTRWPRSSKTAMARKIVQIVEQHLASRG